MKEYQTVIIKNLDGGDEHAQLVSSTLNKAVEDGFRVHKMCAVPTSEYGTALLVIILEREKNG